MNDVNEPNQTNESQSHPDRPVAFCQNCGKPLNRETVRIVGPATFCEPCLAARLAGTPVTPGYSAGFPPSDATASAGWAVPPSPLDQPNPGLAALLGFIPGVGAMYNGQYAKGIIHLIVFAILVSLSNVNGIFGLLIAGWVFYMAIEAHHTAQARRDGTPLPNPFGLNDIGERLGFGSSWPAGPNVADVVHDAVRSATQGFASAPPSPNGPAQTQAAMPPYGQATGSWGAPADAYSYAPPSAANYGQSYAQQYPQSYGAPFSPPIVPEPQFIAPPRNRFPGGAIWLIGLGVVFLLSTTGIFNGFSGSALLGVALIALGIWSFTRRMLQTGISFTDDGTPGYQLRVLRALRVSVWLVLIGILSLLDALRLVTWHRSWPIFIIAAGVIALLDRTIYNSAAAAGFPPRMHSPSVGYAPSAAPQTAPVPPASVPSSDSHPHDSHQEGN